MSNTCFVCHGPAGEENPSALRLDSFEAATSEVPSGEGRAIVPGDPANSVVYQRLISADDDVRMPPGDFRHQLSARDKALFKLWIEQGAQYQRHWSYAPLRSPTVPQVDLSSVDSANEGIANEIDAFVLAKLATAGLQPSPSADRPTLLRRLSLDLIGLPPTPAEVAAFSADQSANAYERAVDRLLASPHFGERMAAPWLDIVRFADTVGFHGDQNQRVFSYRDYVIDAFNDNKPFDEFTREQIAGDLLPNPTHEQLIATAFTRLNMMTREGGAQAKEYLAKYTADRVRAVGTAWLGSTLGCCECHDHKYDPFSTKDFYSLGAFFADLKQWGVYANYGYTPNPDLLGFDNESPFPPELYVQSDSLNGRIEYLQRVGDEKIASSLPETIVDSAPFRQWLQATRTLLESFNDGWVVGAIDESFASRGTEFVSRGDGSLLFKGSPKEDEELTLHVTVPTSMLGNAIRLEVLPDDAHAGHVGRAKQGSFRVKFAAYVLRSGETEREELKIAWAQPDHESPRKYRSGRAPTYLGEEWQSLPERWQLPADGSKRPHTAVYHFSKPVQLTPDDRLIVRLESRDVGRVRLSVTPLAEAIPGRAAASERLRSALSRSTSEWQQSDIDCVVAAYYRATTPADEVSDTCKNLRRAVVDCRAGYSHTLIAQSVPEDRRLAMRVLPRGNWQDESGEFVDPGVPEFLPQPKGSGVRRLTRLDLADWLVSAENPLTARHLANRLWKQFFGAGLSGKLDDLGNQGEWPSHPQLLDWLACQLRDSGWDTKQTIKLIVMSNTYRQRAAWRSDLSEVDPYNRLLAQQSARRLEAETVRDNALAISGLLSCELIGGPSVFPYQPDGYYANLQFPNRRYSSDVDDRQYRRGVYMHWQRTFLHPMLANFDAPARDECAADRVISNSPQQALTLLNDPTFVEASHTMAARVLKESPGVEFVERLNYAFELALSRGASTAEQASLQSLYQRQYEYYTANAAEAKAFRSNGRRHTTTEIPDQQLAAWSQVCRVILNLHETITRF
ncbi:MAG: PSD1 and planctomycete cytochrome C domain-containing protein [Planctomycetota bacterium]